MSDLNIYEDSRNRGLEVFLHQPEKEPEDENEKFKINLKIPLCLDRYFHFQIEFFTTKKSKFLEKE